MFTLGLIVSILFNIAHSGNDITVDGGKTMKSRRLMNEYNILKSIHNPKVNTLNTDDNGHKIKNWVNKFKQKFNDITNINIMEQQKRRLNGASIMITENFQKNNGQQRRSFGNKNNSDNKEKINIKRSNAVGRANTFKDIMRGKLSENDINKNKNKHDGNDLEKQLRQRQKKRKYYFQKTGIKPRDKYYINMYKNNNKNNNINPNKKQ